MLNNKIKSAATDSANLAVSTLPAQSVAMSEVCVALNKKFRAEDPNILSFGEYQTAQNSQIIVYVHDVALAEKQKLLEKMQGSSPYPLALRKLGVVQAGPANNDDLD